MGRGTAWIIWEKLSQALRQRQREKRSMGGVFELANSISKRLFCGVFVRKEHIAVEFDRGTDLKAPTGLLEGSGKVRRHIKIRSIADMKTKRPEGFVRRSFEWRFL